MNATVSKTKGVWPVVLTPFTKDNAVDYKSLERLIDWYIKAGVSGLFVVCQSSEMFFLSDKESINIARFSCDYVDKRIPVIASGHTAESKEEQAEQVAKMSETGIQSLIFITNRFASAKEGDEIFLKRLEYVEKHVPSSLTLGLYECPYPYKRLISDEILNYCVKSGRYAFIKDTCCDINIIKKRLKIIEGSEIKLMNANSATLLASLKAGAHGYCGVMANFHPELYVWLCRQFLNHLEEANILSLYLTVSSLEENLDYPLSAKEFHQQIGTFSSSRCRTKPYPLNPLFVDMTNQMMELGRHMKTFLRIT